DDMQVDDYENEDAMKAEGKFADDEESSSEIEECDEEMKKGNHDIDDTEDNFQNFAEKSPPLYSGARITELFLQHLPWESKSANLPEMPENQQSSFIYIPVIGQLQSLFSGLKKSDLLHGGRVKDNPSAIEDIFDGKTYKDIFEDDFFKGTHKGRKEKEIHISLQLNTDGVALFRSSNYSVWPLYLTVNELNPKLRYSAECRLFAGLWYGINKPTMSIFLQPLVEELKSLYETGTDVVLEGSSLLLRAVLHSVVCDAPARCLVQNFVQFNGYFGCGTCLSKGKSVKTGERGSMMSYPFDISEAGNLTGVSTPRTHTQCLTDARRAEEDGSSRNGVKGFSPLYKLPFFLI
ncbi:uncharacterized protein LOC124272946, partial [Haliotis rubra]|uniref:uncharacterized protein LOC124272946 n=1 Tax=Haliotis rubra TaxID=36100 RepID=UPI001EE5479A